MAEVATRILEKIFLLQLLFFMPVINFKTNYNNKLDCTCFSHIDEAPPHPIPESKLRDTVFEIHTLDNSHPPVKVKMINLLRVPLCALTDSLTLPSHGMESKEYQDWVLKNKPNYQVNRPMAVYYYRREDAG